MYGRESETVYVKQYDMIISLGAFSLVYEYAASQQYPNRYVEQT